MAADSQRREAVHAAQRRMGMEPRDDSALTERFAAGEADPEYATPEEVAHELCVVDHIYRTTLYGEVIEDVMRGVAHRLREETGRRLPWGEVWRIVRFYVPTMLKVHCLRASGQLLDADGEGW